MGEERLRKITMDLVKLDEPLPVANYITSLSENEIYSLFNYIKESKYSEMNIYTAIMRFSVDYLKSINCPLGYNTVWDKEMAHKSKML